MKLRGWTAAAVTASLLVLSGCSSVPPGAAAVVDGTTIPRSDVTELAEAQCAGIRQAVEQGGQAQPAPRKQLVQQSLGLLMDIELNLQYGEDQGVSPRPQEVAATYAQVRPLIEELPERYQEFMEDTFQDWARGRDMLTQIGARATGQQPTGENTDELLNAGYQQREEWLPQADIETDPRYGPAGVGFPGGADPSVSQAVSDFAKDAAAEQPDQAWVSSLPAGQKCG